MRARWVCSTMAACLLLPACTTSDLFPGARVVTVDGTPIVVRPLAGRANTYQAILDDPTMAEALTLQSVDYGKQERAIAAATGCRVDPRTVERRNNNTIATVICG